MLSPLRSAERKLLIFDTHPIQYRSPVFQVLAKSGQSELKVYFFNAQFNGKRWWFHEVGKIPKQVWGRKLDVGFASEVIGTDSLSLWRRWWKLHEILAKERPSAVAIYGYYLIEHWILRWLCGRMGISVIFIGETFTASQSTWRGWIKAPLLRYFFSGISQFITIGERNRSYYLEKGISDSRVTQARYCVDVDFFALPSEQSKGERQRWRRDFRIPESAFVVLFVARLFERKRPYDLLEIEKRLGEDSDVHFVVVGNGPLEAELRILAATQNRIHFIGFRNQAETRSCYHGADVLIVPSQYETWGLVVNEAFACGIPALVTTTCGVAGDLVLDGETGFVFPVGAVDKAVQLIQALADNRSECQRLGENARKLVFKEFRPEHFAAAFLTAFSRVGTRRNRS